MLLILKIVLVCFTLLFTPPGFAAQLVEKQQISIPRSAFEEKMSFNSVQLSPISIEIEKAMSQVDMQRAGVDRRFLKFTKNIHLKNLVEGQEIFQEYKRLISRAQHEILIMSFVWHFTGSFDHSLKEKGQRWQDVNIQKYQALDAVVSIGEGLKEAQKNIPEGSKVVVKILINEHYFQRLFVKNPVESIGSSIEYWVKNGLNPKKFEFQIGSLSHIAFGLTHDKFLVVDGKYAVFTGANIQFSNNYSLHRWHDLGVSMKGSVALALLNVFDLKWFKKAIFWECYGASCARRGSYSTIHRAWMRAIENEAKSLQKGVFAMVLPQAAKGYGKEPKSPQNLGWIYAINTAKRSIYVQSPSVNSYMFIDALIQASLRGVDVRVITSQKFNDLIFNHFLSYFLPIGTSNEYSVKKEILRRIKEKTTSENRDQVLKRINFKWYSKDGKNPILRNGSNAMHSKLLIIDNRIVITGSGNQDVASWRYFSETNICIDSRNNALEMVERVFQPNWEKGIPIVIQ